MSKVEDAVENLTLKLLSNTPYELVDVEYVREKNWYLRIFIDKEGGVDLDDCQEISTKIDELLEKENLLNDSYILEVSSPGLDRILKKERDFVREKGKMVDITMYQPFNGKKSFTGKLLDFSKENLVLSIEDEEINLPRNQIANVRLHIDF